MIKIVLFLLILPIIQINNNSKLVKIELTNGQIVYYDEIGLSSSRNSNLQHSIRVESKGNSFYLHFDRINEIQLKNKTPKAITAEVFFIGGKTVKFKILNEKVSCRLGEETKDIPFVTIRKIKFIKF